jgi:linoleoyl-CoA desaturase
MLSIRFNNKNAEFFKTLRERTDNYFKENNIKPTGDFRLYLKTIVFLSSLSALYILLVFVELPLWLSILFCIILGGVFSGIGFNIMHDGAHGSYSSKKWINSLMGNVLNVLGGDVSIWQQKHNNNHHSFTNIEGMDDDIDIKPFIRVHADQKRYWFHKFQHFYALFLYGLTYVFWIFFNDFKKYFSGKIADNTPIKKMSFADHFKFWISKVVFSFLFLAIPIYFKGWAAVLGFVIMAYTAGVIIAIVFQLAHIVEDIEFVNPTEKQLKIENDWAIHQINTTVNFATKNKLVSWLLGGLNFQVEHHLFPRVSHVHYPKLNEILKQTCAEFNVAYREFPSMTRAFFSHLQHLKVIGQKA